MVTVVTVMAMVVVAVRRVPEGQKVVTSHRKSTSKNKGKSEG
jgi:hypothetical protein